ncbi:hypothetical protein DEA8626_03750 [Defluviimonas aquaemixtae]|uniref:Probable branched-chain-amino-acid aminotransferase n=1 Tax=Albidovulum aquaemixtae TaxID=1542388 RepID=A0A2R8BMQ5_9RHOB|nr:hypothetical protein [Defluviimonas aquaemixtae]SPH24712.1 hypothetical protein DEA8626_03750 [Defluviimonas aquaemixtae]
MRSHPELSDHYADPSTCPPSVACMDVQYLLIGLVKISVLDYGLLHSDATHDVVHAWKGVFFRLEDHLERFFAGLEKLHMAISHDKAQVTEILKKIS